MRSTLLMWAALALVVAACGGGEEVATTTSEAPPSTTTSEPGTTSTTASPTTTTTVAATTTTTQQIDVRFGNDFVGSPGRISVAVGDQVSVWVLSADADAEIHVHGYDLFFDATAGVPVEVAFTADVPGIFEVEVEGSHTLLFDLEVTP